MVDEGNAQLSAVGFFNGMLGGGDAVGVGGGGGGGAPGAFDIEGDKVVRCGLSFGRKWLTCSDTALAALAAGRAPSGAIYASVAHDGSATPSLSVKHAAELPENGLDVTNRLLYRAEGPEGGKYWADYRAAVTVVALD